MLLVAARLLSIVSLFAEMSVFGNLSTRGTRRLPAEDQEGAGVDDAYDTRGDNAMLKLYHLRTF